MPTRAKAARASGDYVVTCAAVNVLVDYEDMDGNTKKRVKSFERGAELTSDDLKYTDVKRLLKLKGIRSADEEEEEEEEEPMNPSQGAAKSASKVPESEGAKVPQNS